MSETESLPSLMESLDALKAIPFRVRYFLACTEAGRVRKRGHNTDRNYMFATDSDVIDHCKAICAKWGLGVHQSVEPDTSQMDTTLKSARNTPMTGHYCEMFTFLFDPFAAEHSDSIPRVLSLGYSADAGDKAVYKAQTGARKYGLLLALNVATGDDAESPGLADDTPPQNRHEQQRRLTGEQLQAIEKLAKEAEVSKGQVLAKARQIAGNKDARMTDLKPEHLRELVAQLSAKADEVRKRAETPA